MKDQKEVIKKVVDYIERNLEEEINLDNISKNIGYSKFHLNRVFTEQTGITIYKYLQNRRLTIAAEKLVKTDKSIIQIAYEAGYDTQQSFSFAFKQVYLYPPKTYRDIGIFMPKQNKISMCYSYMPKYYKFIAEVKEIAA
ncbi:MAG: helix-turn-helix transcriptional regulator [Lachnospiraceae bacterium]|nr:helix-turn-helix transcriptional regulator [Lachnospiraceae bacterium]